MEPLIQWPKLTIQVAGTLKHLFLNLVSMNDDHIYIQPTLSAYSKICQIVLDSISNEIKQILCWANLLLRNQLNLSQNNYWVCAD